MTANRVTREEYAKMTAVTKPKKRQLEGKIKSQIKAYLQLQGWCVKYIVQGQFSEPGLPDVLAFRQGRVVFIEVKTPDGRLSDHQKAFQAECEHQGVTYLVARSVADVLDLGGRQEVLRT